MKDVSEWQRNGERKKNERERGDGGNKRINVHSVKN